MNGCKNRVAYTVPSGFHHKTFDYPCGATGIDGNPVLCVSCEKKHAGRDWRREAEEAGEIWDEEGY